MVKGGAGSSEGLLAQMMCWIMSCLLLSVPYCKVQRNVIAAVMYI